MKILSIDVGGTAIKYGLTDENFNVLEFHEISTEARLGGPHVMQQLLNIVGRYRGEIACVGVSTAGQVDPAEGTILFADNAVPRYTGTEIKKNIREKYNISVSVENDVNAAATAEAAFGNGRGCSDFLCLTYGTGIGGAVWLNGKLYTGRDFSAGEFGHIVTHAGGRRCRCGSCGCYQMYASASALIRAVKEETDRDLTGRQIFEPENFQNALVRAVIDSWIGEVVAGLVTLVSVFDPPRLILGGGVMNEDYIIREIEKRIRAGSMPGFHSVEIKRAALKNRAGMLGAACLAKAEFGGNEQ